MAKDGDRVGAAFVELGLNKSPFIDAMQDAGRTFQSMLSTMGSQAAGFAKQAGGLLGTIGVDIPSGILQGNLQGLAQTAAEAVKSFADSEGTMLEFAVASRRVGETSGQAFANLDELHTKLGKLGTTTRPQLAQLVTVFKQLGIHGAELEKVSSQVFGLAAIGNIPLEEATALVRKGLIDPASLSSEELARVGAIVAPGASPQAKFAALMDMATEGMEVAAQSVGLVSVQIRELDNAVQDLKNAAGELLSEPFAKLATPKDVREKFEKAVREGDISQEDADRFFRLQESGTGQTKTARFLDLTEQNIGKLSRRGLIGSLFDEAQKGRILEKSDTGEDVGLLRSLSRRARNKSVRSERQLGNIANAAFNARQDNLTPDELRRAGGDPRNLVTSEANQAAMDANTAALNANTAAQQATNVQRGKQDPANPQPEF